MRGNIHTLVLTSRLMLQSARIPINTNVRWCAHEDTHKYTKIHACRLGMCSKGGVYEYMSEHTYKHTHTHTYMSSRRLQLLEGTHNPYSPLSTSPSNHSSRSHWYLCQCVSLCVFVCIYTQTYNVQPVLPIVNTFVWTTSLRSHSRVFEHVCSGFSVCIFLYMYIYMYLHVMFSLYCLL
jgi:hypothetical protein